MNNRQAIEEASRRIVRRDAETLLCHILHRDRAWLMAYPEVELPAEDHLRFEALVQRRTAHMPLQYLTGHQEFFGLDLRVTPAVLIPRPETELLVEAVLLWAADEPADRPMRFVDVGTGSGAIALALASRLPEAAIDAVDLSEAALAVATENAARVALQGRVRFLRSDLLDAFRNPGAVSVPFDAVVSNPPYVPVTDGPDLQPEVREFEPHLALFAEENGLAVYRRLIPAAEACLRSGGLLAMEFGYGQKPALAQMLADWADVRFLDDYAGIPRVVLAVRR